MVRRCIGDPRHALRRSRAAHGLHGAVRLLHAAAFGDRAVVGRGVRVGGVEPGGARLSRRMARPRAGPTAPRRAARRHARHAGPLDVPRPAGRSPLRAPRRALHGVGPLRARLDRHSPREREGRAVGGPPRAVVVRDRQRRARARARSRRAARPGGHARVGPRPSPAPLEGVRRDRAPRPRPPAHRHPR